MKHGLALLPAVFLAACAGTSSPGWLLETDAALTAHRAAYLNGNERVAARELALARREVGRTGDAVLMARVELTVCAAEVASLAGDGCPDFVPLAADAGPAERTYAAYLAGQAFDAVLLPPAQQNAWQNGSYAALAAIEDPLSRLVAAGVLWRSGRLPDSAYGLAIDTAASQGWRRSLLAWLATDRDRRLAAGDAPGAEAQQRRIERMIEAAKQ